jgi:hypothetical protein
VNALLRYRSDVNERFWGWRNCTPEWEATTVEVSPVLITVEMHEVAPAAHGKRGYFFEPCHLSDPTDDRAFIQQMVRTLQRATDSTAAVKVGIQGDVFVRPTSLDPAIGVTVDLRSD